MRGISEVVHGSATTCAGTPDALAPSMRAFSICFVLLMVTTASAGQQPVPRTARVLDEVERSLTAIESDEEDAEGAPKKKRRRRRRKAGE